MSGPDLDALTEQIWQRLTERRPRALLIGAPPEIGHNYYYVKEEPYEAVVLGDLPPGELLKMPTDPVCRALLADMPVYLWSGQSYKKAKTARLLCTELAAAEKHLRQLGVKPLEAAGEARLITAQEARRLLEAGARPPKGSRLTPLARDILEGKEP